MTYESLLSKLNEAIAEADKLENEFDDSKEKLDRVRVLSDELIDFGFELSDNQITEVKDAFNSGDYISAGKLGSSLGNELENCKTAYMDTKNLYEMMDTFELVHDTSFEDLKSEINEMMMAGKFKKANNLISSDNEAMRSQLGDYEQAQGLVSQLNELIIEAKDHILIEKFVPEEESAEQLLEKRKLKSCIEVSESAIKSVKNSLNSWRPDIKVTLPDDLVSGESNRAIVLLQNKGKAKAKSVGLIIDGINSAGSGGSLSTGEIAPGNSEEIVVGLIPSTPGNIPVKVTVDAVRSYDSAETSVDEQIWVEIQRPGVVNTPSKSQKKVKEEIPKEEAIKLKPEWEIPTDLSEEESIVGEFFSKRWESYMAYPNNKVILDFLHNNRDKYAISSYFEVPTDPKIIMEDWALPKNLRGNVHLDSKRKEIVRDIVESSFEDNFVIIGEPGVGKTVLLFEIFDKLMEREPVGIITNENIGNAHEQFKIRLFYDDISEKPDLYNVIASKEKMSGLILSSREAEWSELPVDFRKKFTRLTVPRFSDDEMESLILKTLDVNTILFDTKAVKTLVSYAQGSPIYVGSLIKEMVYSDVRRLSQTYLKENAQKGMAGYVTMILQRLLKVGNEYRTGGLHTLSCLIFLANHVEERRCHEQLLRAFADEIDEPMEEKFDDVYDRRTFNRSVDYLSGQGSLVRFPHDTWVDILQGQGAANPFRSDIQEIRKEFEDTGLFETLKKDAIDDAWEAIKKRYNKSPVREKNSFLELCDTLTSNFRLSDLKDMEVDIEMVREVASKHRDAPVAASILSRLEGAEPTHNVINIQDSVISKSNIGSDGSANVEDSIIHKSQTGK